MHYGLLIKTRLELGDMPIFPTPSGSQTGKLFYCLFCFFLLFCTVARMGACCARFPIMRSAVMLRMQDQN
jgi:hypothetical protein